MEENWQVIASKIFKILNRFFMVPMWRLGLGKHLNMGPMSFGRYMVLDHSGRKTGKRYLTPVNYTIIGDDLFCCAGFGAKSDWYQNIIENPRVEVWLPDGWFTGLAEDISGDENRLAILREVLIASGFAARLFAGVNIDDVTQEELAELTSTYRLVRIRRISERTGSGGPGEYAWIWPITTGIFALFYLLKPGRKKDQ